MILIGIDTGKDTGFAKVIDGRLVEVKTLTIIEALEQAKDTINFACQNHHAIKFYIEDARLRKWVTGGHEKLQGVGSVKRDSAIWEEFCLHHNVDFKLVAPKDNNTKLSADTFKHLTKWSKRTSQHARDAAMLIWGR